MKRHVALLCLLAARPGLAEAQQAGVSVPRPAPEMVQLRFFAATWSCDGKAPASPAGPSRRTQSTVRIAPELDGFWYSIRYEEARSSDNALAGKGLAYWGYDSSLRKFVETGLDNMGGVATETSSGWEGDKMVWTGHLMLMGEETNIRDTFVKKSAIELLHTAEAQSNTRWSVIVEETCRKTQGP